MHKVWGELGLLFKQKVILSIELTHLELGDFLQNQSLNSENLRDYPKIMENSRVLL